MIIMRAAKTKDRERGMFMLLSFIFVSFISIFLIRKNSFARTKKTAGGLLFRNKKERLEEEE
jgi:hypothetical protein